MYMKEFFRPMPFIYASIKRYPLYEQLVQNIVDGVAQVYTFPQVYLFKFAALLPPGS
jgi:hypothetical protein